jgi:hypothetical protein
MCCEIFPVEGRSYLLTYLTHQSSFPVTIAIFNSPIALVTWMSRGQASGRLLAAVLCL